MIKLSNLRDFVAAVEAGSIRSAARDLKVTQPAISKSIQSLERALEVQLFHRLPHGLSLTTFGKAYYTRAKTITKEIERGEEEMRYLKGEGDTSLAFGASATASLLFLSQAITDYKKRFAQSRIRIVGGTFSVMYPELRDGLIDFCIGPRPDHDLDSNFLVQSLFSHPCVVVARRGHPRSEATRLQELLDECWLVSGATDTDSATHIRAFERNGLTIPTQTIRCEYSPAMLSLLSGSDMLMMLPRVWAESPFGASVLSIVPVVDPLPFADISIMRRKGLDLAPAAAYMVTVFERLIAAAAKP